MLRQPGPPLLRGLGYTDSRIHPFKQRDVTPSFTSPAVGGDPDILSPNFGLMQISEGGLKKTFRKRIQGAALGTLLNDWMRPHLHGRYWNHNFFLLMLVSSSIFLSYFVFFFHISSQGSTSGPKKILFNSTSKCLIDIVDLCAYIIPNVSNNVQTQTVSIGRRSLLQSGW